MTFTQSNQQPAAIVPMIGNQQHHPHPLAFAQNPPHRGGAIANPSSGGGSDPEQDFPSALIISRKSEMEFPSTWGRGG